MQNRLAEHLTTWKFWYAIPAAASLLLSSLLPVIASFVIDPDSPSAASTMALLIPLQFIAFALLALGFIALVEKKWPTTRDLGLTRGFSMRSIIVVAVGFSVSHLLFWLLAFGAPISGSRPSHTSRKPNWAGPSSQRSRPCSPA